jgi:hypothetical protein
VTLDQQKATKIHMLYQEHGEPSLGMFGLDRHIPTLTLVGDTKYKEPDMVLLGPFFKKLVEALMRLNFPIAVIDGATDFGVMKLFGNACEQSKKKPAAVIGVTLRAAVEEEKMPLEPHHSHIFLAQGKRGEWAAAVPVMEKIRAVVTGEQPSVLLAVGGGAVTLRHMYEHAQAGVPLYVLLGSGLLPQGFVEAQKSFPDPGYPYSIEEHKHLLSSGLVKLLRLSETHQAIDTLKKGLTSQDKILLH